MSLEEEIPLSLPQQAEARSRNMTHDEIMTTMYRKELGRIVHDADLTGQPQLRAQQIRADQTMRELGLLAAQTGSERLPYFVQ